MGTKAKKQGLLNPVKQPAKGAKKGKSPQKGPQKAQKAQAQAGASASAPAKKKSKTPLLIFISILAIGFVLAPKPQLVTYHKLDVVTKSVYISGLFGEPGQLLDSNQLVVIDESSSALYLCYPDTAEENCSRYNLVHKEGMVSAGIYWIKSKF